MLVADVTLPDFYIDALPNVKSELAIPLIVKNRVIGVIDLEAREKGYFTEEHKRVLTLIASRMAVGIENARLHTRITRQARTLALLNEIARELTSILNLDELLKRIAEMLQRLIDYQMFSILLLDATGEKLQHRFSQRFEQRMRLKHDIPLGRGVVGHAAEAKEAMLVPDVTKSSLYIAVNPETRSELAVPLIYQEKVIGVLDLEHTRRNYFTEDHKRTLTTLAAQLAIAIENARLYEEIARQESRLERDLALARELQFRLLPHSLPKLPHLEVQAKSFPPEPSAAISTTSSRTPFRVWELQLATWRKRRASSYLRSARQRNSPFACPHRTRSRGDAFGRESVVGRAPHRRSVCLHIYAVWDDAARTLLVANSGLPLPLYCHDGKIERIEATGLPLGLFDEADYDEFSFKAKPGDMFVFFSDGILDARNRHGQSFGPERVEAIVAGCAEQSPDCVVSNIFTAVTEHAAGVEAFDDQTVVAIRVKGGAARRK